MRNVESRLKRAESIIGDMPEPSAWEGFDEAVRPLLARAGISAGSALALARGEADKVGPRIASWSKEPDPDAVQAMRDAADQLRDRLAARGLLYGPLTEEQRAEARQIAEQMRSGWR